jgi:predicted kinase
MTSLAQRRKTDRERQKRWRQRQNNQGKKQISVMISLKAQLILNREKKKNRETNSEVIERAILNLTGK